MKNQVISLVLVALAGLCKDISELIGVPTPSSTTAPVAVAPVAAPAVAVVPVAPGAAPAAVAPVAAPVPPAAPAAVAVPAAAFLADLNASLDSEGLPWDIRIHSGGKTFYARKAANGTPAGGWKLKKGVNAATVAQIKTELRASYPAPGTAAPDTVIAQSTVVPVDPGTVVYSGPLPSAAAVAPVAAGVPVNLAEYGTITTWGELMRQIVHAGMDKAVANAKCVEFGVTSLAELQNSPTLIPAVAQGLGLTK